jgi:glycerophosphoryl diester phosphodiesterase
VNTSPPNHAILRAVSSNSPYLDEPPLAFAHRGGAAQGDENTEQAFARADAAGYRYVETDVHATRDGVAVVMHDDTLDRMTGVHARVGELSYRDLASVRVAGAAAIPTLGEVLEAWPRIRFNIDIKSDAAVAPTVAAVDRADAGSRVLLASFSDSRLRDVRTRTKGKIATSLAQREVTRFWLASRVGLRVRVPESAVAVQVPVRHGRLRVVDQPFLTLAHRLGLQVHVWTIDDPGEMAGLLDLGVDGIMTDRIEVLKEVFVQRGLWKGQA